MTPSTRLLVLSAVCVAFALAALPAWADESPDLALKHGGTRGRKQRLVGAVTCLAQIFGPVRRERQQTGQQK